ncbi:MAG: hypothetical protein ACLQT5_09750 [Steroidobacteraceae bacterium]|jgi:hypothetical protein
MPCVKEPPQGFCDAARTDPLLPAAKAVPPTKATVIGAATAAMQRKIRLNKYFPFGRMAELLQHAGADGNCKPAEA